MSTHDPPPSMPCSLSHPTCQRRHRPRPRLPLAHIVGVIALLSCLILSTPRLASAQQQPGSGSGAPAGPTTPITIKLGVVLPLKITTSNASEADLRRQKNAETGLTAIRTAIEQSMSLDASRHLDKEFTNTVTQLGIKFELIVRDSSEPGNVTSLQLANRSLQLPGRAKSLDMVPSQSIAATMDVISQGAVAIVGDLTSDATLYSAMLSSRLGILQCSFAAGAPGLSNKNVYPYFFRTLSPVSMQLNGLRHLMEANGWRKVLVLANMDQFGTGLVKELTGSNTGSSAMFQVYQFPVNDTATLGNHLDAIAEARERIIFSGVLSPDQEQVVRLAAQRKLLGNSGRQWIFLNNVTDAAINARVPTTLLEGSLSLVSPDPAGEDEMYVKIKNSWGRITNSTFDRFYFNELSALACGHMLIRGVVKYITEAPDRQATAAALARGELSRGPMTLESVSSVNWRGPYGIQTLDKNGDMLLGYEFLNWQRGASKMDADTGVKMIGLNGSRPNFVGGKLVYMNGQKEFKQSVSMEDVTIKLQSNGGYVIITCCVVGVVIAIGFLFAIIHNRNAPTIRAISPTFCTMVLLGLILLYVAIAFQLFIEDDLQCNVTPASAVIGLALVIGNIIAKNQRIWQLFGSPLSFRHGLPDHHIMRISLGILFINVALTIWWLVASPFHRVLVSFGEYKQYRTCLPVAASIEQLTTEEIPSLYERPAFVGVCLFNGLLLVYAVVLAWNTRRIPIRGYNESRAISLSIYNIFLGGAILLPTFFQPLNGFYPVVFALRTMVMLFCASFALLVFFIPPLYTLWLDRATTHGGDDAPAMDAPGIAPIGLPNTPATPHAFMDSKPPRTSFAGGLGDDAVAMEGANVAGPLPSTTTPSTWPPHATDGTAHSLSRRRPHSNGSQYPSVMRITQRPEKVSETYEGTLVMRRSHRLTANSSILKCIFDRFNPWQVVHVTLIPHRQVLLLTEQVKACSDASNMVGATHTPTATTTPPDTEPEMISIVYQAVRSPHDVARERFAQRDRAMALSVLPTRGLYAADTSGSSASDTAGKHGNPSQPRVSLDAAAAAAQSVAASVRAKQFEFFGTPAVGPTACHDAGAAAAPSGHSTSDEYCGVM
ncbi:hypothetical protein BCR44DRAFT_306264 [Catenaria anguillulae PL171]|uniref:G-protein coupled receptors family 3 profile domain-containing protein n=1 Tax=Catenaria anguillulae PL171 TaxID=765915 RepID=A0A1Y2I704_9FUNG|nr:hypothetical protein BCR44DRAFT_306264 [Catenaria anguillulae PL171]